MVTIKMQNNRPKNDIQSRQTTLLCAQSAPTLAARAALAYALLFLTESSARHENQFSSDPHMPVTSLTCNFWYSWISTRAVSPFRVRMASASCRRGNDLPCSWSSNRNSRRTSRTLAEIRNSIIALGSCRSSPGEIAEIGTRCLLWVGSIVRASLT